jgi:hypothetical protein
MIVKDLIVERTVTDVCPPISQVKIDTSKKGFPEPPVVVSEKTYHKPSADDLTISARDIAKLEWTNPVDESETSDSGAARFDLEGNEISESSEYKSELHHHGKEPGRPGYTFEELFHLSQSGFPAQKSLAIQTLGNIAEKVSAKGRSYRRKFHRTLLGEWKAHIRFSVACSDTSVNVRTAAWIGLYKLINFLDKECGCVAADLASVPEFFRAFNPDDEMCVKGFLYIINSFGETEEEEQLDEVKEMISEAVLEAAEKLNLQPNEFKCGVGSTGQQIQTLANTETAPAPEIIATLCDRLACLAHEPLSTEDVVYFEEMLGKLKPGIPFFAPGQVDEFSWANRCNMVAKALTEFSGESKVGVVVARFCWLFTSSLFPLECRASIWSNTELVVNIERLVEVEGGNSLKLLGNHGTLDFACKDVTEIDRENATVCRSFSHSCRKFIEEHTADEQSEIMLACKELLTRLETI